MPQEAYAHVWGYPEGCPACDKLKGMLTALSINFQFHPIERDSPERQLLRDAGFATVPQVFDVDGRHIGDYGTLRLRAKQAVEAALLGH